MVPVDPVEPSRPSGSTETTDLPAPCADALQNHIPNLLTVISEAARKEHIRAMASNLIAMASNLFISEAARNDSYGTTQPL